MFHKDTYQYPFPLKLDKQRGYYITVLAHSPHFTDTGFDTEIIEGPILLWAYDQEEARENAQCLVPPMVDPGLIEIVLQPLI